MDKIKIYGKEGCGACKNVKSKLEDKEIDHTYIGDVDKTIAKAREVGQMTVPICEVNGEILSLKEMLEYIKEV